MRRGGCCIGCGHARIIWGSGVYCILYGIPVWKEKRTCDGWTDIKLMIEKEEENETVLPGDGDRDGERQRGA